MNPVSITTVRIMRLGLIGCVKTADRLAISTHTGDVGPVAPV